MVAYLIGRKPGIFLATGFHLPLADLKYTSQLGKPTFPGADVSEMVVVI